MRAKMSKAAKAELTLILSQMVQDAELFAAENDKKGPELYPYLVGVLQAKIGILIDDINGAERR